MQYSKNPQEVPHFPNFSPKDPTVSFYLSKEHTGGIIMKNTSYKKSTSQIALENILHFINHSGMYISQLKSDKKYTALNHDLYVALTGVIDVLVHEDRIHNLIVSIAQSYGAQYYEDLHEYDTLFEVMSETLIGLNSVITKASGEVNNIGRVRIDTYQDKEPEQFVCILRNYIRNNICKDLARKLSKRAKHIEPDTTLSNDDEDDEIYKADSILYNKRGLENTINFADDICKHDTYELDMKSSLFDAVISRFGTRKPVAAYIYLLIMDSHYDTMTVVRDLKETTDFNQLFHQLLHKIELDYDVDLSSYNNICFNVDKYLSSFRSIDDESARARIDRLKSTTCKDVMELKTFKVVKSKHVEIVGNNLFI